MKKWYIIGNENYIYHYCVKRLIDQNKNVKVFMLKANNGDQYVKNILEELKVGG